MEPIKQSEYWAEIRAIAKSAAEEAEGDRDLASEKVHETVNGHQWIIYTYYNMQVLAHSKNENAHFELYGRLEADCFSTAIEIMARAAMLADVFDELETARDAYEVEQSE